MSSTKTSPAIPSAQSKQTSSAQNVSCDIVFAGTPDFAAAHLEALITAGYRPSLVLTQPDRPAGRGRKLTPSPVKQIAEKYAIDVFQPQQLDEEAKAHLLARPTPTLLIVVAYGLLLPQWTLDWARRGAINVHASLLPRWRGAAPIQRAIEAGDKVTGVGIMQMDIGLDTGAIWREAQVTITDTLCAGQLHDALQTKGCALLIETLPIILAGDEQPTPQAPMGVTYAKKLTKQEAQIAWAETPEVICRKIRAFNPVPVAHSETTDGRRFRFYHATPLSPEAYRELTNAQRDSAMTDTDALLGCVLHEDKNAIVIACQSGAIAVHELQEIGKKRLTTQQFINGNSLAGARFV